MRKTGIPFAFFLLLQATVYSQQPHDKLAAWGTQNPIEKVYLQFDREDYIPGQTLWFKSYIMSGFLPGETSTTLYVELLTDASAIIKRKIFPVYSGFAKGQIELPENLQPGQYFVRAYSPTMLNHDPSFLYTKRFFIGGKQVQTNNSNEGKKIRLDFFPEGGNFITGLPNTLAFKATDENGLPVKVSGAIKNNKGEIIKDFESIHDGMGQLDIIAEENAGYYAELEGDLTAKKYALPQPTRDGIVFRVLKGANGLHFEILQENGNPVFNASYLVGQMQHKPVFTQTLQTGATIHGLINTTGLLSGVLHLTVFNKNDQPIAERLCFVNNMEFIQYGEIRVDTLSFSARGKNHFTLSLKDTLTGSFSIAITDQGYNTSDQRSENIVSRLLLNADIPGYIHDPAFYFSSADSVNALDLVMMTNGWRRFKWEKLMAGPLPPNQYKDPGYITLRGGVDIYGRSRPFADKELLLFIASGDSSRNIQMIKTDAQGKFQADSLVFFERSAILFSDIGDKKNKFEVKREGTDSLMQVFNLPAISTREIVPFQRAGKEDTRDNKFNAEYDAMLKADGLVLAPVTVKARKKTKMEELEDRYVSGIFLTHANSTIDFTNTNELFAYRNVLEYLQSRLPGVQVVKTGLDYAIYYRQTRTLMGGLIPMQIFLNEMPSDANFISYIPANQIALVKVYGTFVGAEGSAPGGALVVYTKKGADLYSSLNQGPEQIIFKGYSIIKEFYSPDYAQKDNAGITTDHRMTLLWHPDIYAEGENVNIPIVFYNNDRCKSFKVVVEGMTADGKLLMIEKTITGKAF